MGETAFKTIKEGKELRKTKTRSIQTESQIDNIKNHINISFNDDEFYIDTKKRHELGCMIENLAKIIKEKYPEVIWQEVSFKHIPPNVAYLRIEVVDGKVEFSYYEEKER